MNILMLTNTYLPHVGGVARSVEQFASEYRREGHRVMVVAPSFDRAEDDPNVVRIPSIRHFNGTSFSVPLPIPGFLHTALDELQPDIVHSHHPFLLGDTALRIAAFRNVPVVFTHHTLYQKYTHYVIGESDALRRFVTDLAVGYCNLCDAVIAPSETIRAMLREHGVVRRIDVIPTGVVLDRFSQGDGQRFRREHGIPGDAFVVGHVGRLAPEKSIDFLAAAVADFVAKCERAWFLVAGKGPCEEEIRRSFAERDVSERLVSEGELPGGRLSDGYHAMDVFAFASQSETQGMVLTEAMAAGTPVVAVDGPGVRETVRDGSNGRLLATPDLQEFVTALSQFEQMSAAKLRHFQAAAEETAKSMSMAGSARRALSLYSELIRVDSKQHHQDPWVAAGRRVAQEWKLWENIVDSASEAVLQFDDADVAESCS